MNADQLKKLTADALDRLAALLDGGHSDQLAALLKMMARFHRYSLRNLCSIAADRPDATRVAGFHTWRTLGRYVRKGEKGIAIPAPIVGRRSDAAEAVAFVVGVAVRLNVGAPARDCIHLYLGDRDGLIASLDRLLSTTRAGTARPDWRSMSCRSSTTISCTQRGRPECSHGGV